jgi:hypothetical protein
MLGEMLASEPPVLDARFATEPYRVAIVAEPALTFVL